MHTIDARIRFATDAELIAASGDVLWALQRACFEETITKLDQLYSDITAELTRRGVEF